MVRDRSPSVKRGLTDGINSQNKRRNEEKIRKISPLRLIFFCYGIHKGIIKQDIVDDLDKGDIRITIDDIVQMSKPNETSHVVSFKISGVAEDLEKALDPTIWPLYIIGSDILIDMEPQV